MSVAAHSSGPMSAASIAHHRGSRASRGGGGGRNGSAASGGGHGGHGVPNGNGCMEDVTEKASDILRKVPPCTCE